MKRNIIIGLVLLLISTSKSTQAQYAEFGSNMQAMIKFEEAPSLYVILTGDEKFDDALRKAVNTYWKLKPSSFIDKKRAKEMLTDPTFCFLEINSYSGVELGIYMGGPNSILKDKVTGREFGRQYTVADTPFDMFGIENGAGDAIYKLPLMIKGLNDAISFVQINRLKGSGGTFRRKYCKKRSIDASILKNKTLLILDQLNVEPTDKFIIKTSVPKRIMEKYPFKYQYVTKTELTELIKSGSKDYCFFNPCISDSRNIIIYDLETLSPIYIKLEYFYEKKGPLFLRQFVDEKHIEELVKAINSKYKK